MAEKTAGKFSVYVKDGKLKRDIKLIAHYDGVSATELISRILEDYTASRQEDLQTMYKYEEEIEARKRQKAQQTLEAEQFAEEEQQEETQILRQNPNFL